ncbi:MAG: hypothetical protein H6799_00110 [Candidatus Nomurabacteria bacterium]|nr:MAG: hypothetical protein H6799_00110 [Candidatus Nomurabacteria bacterium]HRV76031.1 hypothetical protein [Candidatus Saccharimonadales bacterium]
MADILGKSEVVGDGKGYVGCRYEVTPNPTKEDLESYAAKLRREMGIELMGDQAVTSANTYKEDPAETKTLDLPNTTRSGWWF